MKLDGEVVGMKPNHFVIVDKWLNAHLGAESGVKSVYHMVYAKIPAFRPEMGRRMVDDAIKNYLDFISFTFAPSFIATCQRALLKSSICPYIVHIHFWRKAESIKDTFLHAPVINVLDPKAARHMPPTLRNC